MAQLLDIAGLRENTTHRFRKALYRGAEQLGLNPSYLAAVIALESGFDPKALNPNGRALGLIQFWDSYFPPIAARAGLPAFPWRNLSQLTATDQLRFVFAYYAPNAARLKTPGDYYLQTFMPAAIGKPPATVLGRKGSDETIHGLNAGKVYEQNRGLDVNHDGVLTVGDVTAKIDNIVAAARRRPPIDIGDPYEPEPSPLLPLLMTTGALVGMYLISRQPGPSAILAKLGWDGGGVGRNRKTATA